MNKVDFAVCRIKEKLPEPQGFATKGGGCVVYCERLATSWGWKCPYAIVTPSVVLCHNDLASGKIFVAEFLGKDKKGLEAFEMKQMSEVCKDVVGRSLDQLQPDLYLTFLSVEPLDKRGFLKKMVKRGSLQTFRPLDCYFIETKSVEESTEGLFCRVISDLFSESTGNKPFSTQTFKVVYESQTKRFSLQDFGGYQKTFNQEMPPIGAVIFTNKGEFAGLLRNFSDTRVTPVFLPEPWMKDDGIGEVIKLPNSGNGVCQTEIPGSSAGMQVLESNLRPKSHGSADHLCEEKSLDNDNEDVIVSGDVIFQEQNKLPSSDVVAMESGLMNDPLVQENNNLDHIEETVNTDKALASLKGLEQNQPFPQHSIPANRNDRIITEGVLISANNYSNDHENVKEGMDSKSPDVTKKSFHKTEECFDDTVKASDQTGGGVAADSDLCRTETGLNATEVTPHETSVGPNEADEDLEITKITLDGTYIASDWTILTLGETEGIPKRDEDHERAEDVSGRTEEAFDEIEGALEKKTEVPGKTEVLPGEEDIAPNETGQAVDGIKEVLDETKLPPGKEEEAPGEIKLTIVERGDALEYVDHVQNLIDVSPDATQKGTVGNEVATNKPQGSVDGTEVFPGNGTEDGSDDLLVPPKKTEEMSYKSEVSPGDTNKSPAKTKKVLEWTGESQEQAEVPNNTGELFVKVDSGSLSSEEGRPNGTAGSPEQTEVPNNTGELFAMVDSGLPCSEEGRPNGTAGSPERNEVPNNTGELFTMVDSGPPCSEEGRPNGTAEYPERTEVPNNTGEFFAMVDSGPPCSEEGRPNGTGQVTNEMEVTAQEVDTGLLSGFAGHVNRVVDSELIVRSDETTKVPFQPAEDPPGQVEGGVFVKEGDPDKVRHSSEEGLCEVMRCNGNLMTTMKQMNIEEVFSGCSPQKEDLQMTDTLVDQESGIADNNIIVCKLTVSETTELVGTKPYFGITVPVVSDHVTPDTDSEKELLRDDEFTAVSKDSKDLTEHQERQNFELENQAQTDSMVESLVSLECFKDKTVGLHSSEKIEIGVREQHNLNLQQNDIAISEVKDFKGNAKTDSFKICEELLPQSSQECDQIESSDHDGAFTLKENLGVAGDWSSGVEVRKASDPNLVSLEEETGEISQDKSKILAYDQSAQNSDSRDFFSSVNVNQSGWHITQSTNPAADFEQNSSVNNEDVQVGELRLLNGNAVLQHVDADALLSETVTSNPLILGDLAHCLDTEYQYGMVPCWRDLAELLAIPREVYRDCGTLSITSPTEDLFVFLSATKPQLTIAEIKEALTEIDRLDVAQLLERRITGGVISNESVVTSLVERQDLDILGKMALKLDRKMLQNWKHLALQLSVPHRVLRNLGPCQQYNSSKMLLKYIPVFDPELTLDKLKASFSTVGLRDAVAVLESAEIPGDQPIKNILDDSAFVDQIAELLNDDPPSPNWRHLARELKIPVDKWKVFEPTEDNSSPTRLLFKSIAKCEPDLTFEELVLALVAMKRQDVLDILQKYFSSDDIDQILEENNLLVPMEPDEIQDDTE